MIEAEIQSGLKNQYSPKEIARDFVGKNIISVDQFEYDDLTKLFYDVRCLRNKVEQHNLDEICQGYFLANLFYEPSTRTDLSFDAAMQRLGGGVLKTAGGVQFSSVYKGENLTDTVRAAGCYSDIIVLRHPEVGATYIASEALDWLSWKLGKKVSLISAGDGIGEHPTQGLLDLFTIEDLLMPDGFYTKSKDVSITMVGDLLNGRTVHSLSKLLCKSALPNITINFVSPKELRMPNEILEFIASRGVNYFESGNLHEVLKGSDVVYWTRVQSERFNSKESYEAIKDSYVFTPKMLDEMKHSAILMHPLPRNMEMGTGEDHIVIDNDPRSVYFHQMENGMYVRMALIANVLGKI